MSEFTIDSILEGLNPAQREAVQHDQGPLMIVAGAGTGKTKAITHRIAYLIASKRTKPEEILALTFTDKAAAEMEERVDVMVPYGFANVWISTFHSFGDHILRENALELQLAPDFQVLSQAEQIIFFREHLFEYPLKIYRPLGNPTRFIGALLRLFSRAKDEDVSPDEYLRYAEVLREKAAEHPDDAELNERAAQQMELARTYELHQRLMAENGKSDFGDQVNMTLRLFREHPLLLQQTQQKFKYILVDEFQDTNYAQFELLRLLAGEAKNIAVVADDDQSIYKFRGAAISNVLNFLKVYPDSKMVVLTDNYRSTQPILNAAYRLISHNNPDRLEIQSGIDKRLNARKKEGLAVDHLHYDTLTSEADAVAQIIEDRMKSGGYCHRDFAILVRANNDADPFLRSLNMKNIPFQFSGSRGLYSRPEVRMLIQFLRAITDLSDSVSLYHLAQSEIYQMPVRDLVHCANLANRRNVTLHHVFEHLQEFEEDLELTDEGKATIRKIAEDLQKYLEASRDNSAGAVLYKFLSESGYLGRLARAETIHEEAKVSNIAKFFDQVRSFAELAVEDRIPEFVKHLDALIEAGDDPATVQADSDFDAVNVLTIHKAKGLEFRVVFLVSLVQDRFPTRRKSDPIQLPDPLVKDILPSGDFHIQEERRLFYVGMTRAKEELYLTSARDYGGARPRKISQFVLEALDKPRADETYLRTSPLEAIHRHAPPADRIIEHVARIPADQVLTLSHFQIDDYLTCPLKYKYVHVLRVPILPHHAIIHGKSLHDAVNEYHRRKLSHQPVTVKDLKEMFRKSWRSEGFLSREHEDQRFAAGEAALERFFAEQENSAYLPTYVEKEFGFMLENDRIIGRWDRVDIRNETVHIIDFKSSEVRQQEKADRAARESLQLSIYALAYKEVYQKLPEYVELHYLETGLIGRSNVTERRMEKTIEHIRMAARGIRERKYEPKPSFLACEYCPYNQVCPATAVR